MNNRNNRWLIAAIIVFAFLQPQIARGQSGEYRNLSLAEFIRFLEAKDFLLINVHVPYQGEIPGTDLFLPYHAVERLKGGLPAAKDAKIVVYCMTGPMGYAAAESLIKLGYSQVYHFAGGMREWVRSGRQLIYHSDR